MQETRVPSLGQEDPLEEEMATPSSILAWRIPWTEEPGGFMGSWGHKEWDTTEHAGTPKGVWVGGGEVLSAYQGQGFCGLRTPCEYAKQPPFLL